MEIMQVLKVALAASVALAFVSNLVLYIAFKAHKVEVHFARSVKPGYIENLYRQTPAMHMPLLGVTVRLATLSKILVVVSAIAFFVLRGLAQNQ
jgi:hypothetical protein